MLQGIWDLMGLLLPIDADLDLLIDARILSIETSTILRRWGRI